MSSHRRDQLRDLSHDPRGDPSTRQRDYSADELEFMQAVEKYKREAKRPFPTLSEMLAILKELGYRKG